MSTTYISYSLFTKKHHESNRWYDPLETDYNRYWFNVPALVVANSLYYPGSVMRLHVDPQTHNYQMFPMLSKVKESGLIEICTCEQPFNHTEPTLWRMAPVWSEDYNAVVCRDIDSLPQSREVQCTHAFLNSDFLIQSMRTHPHHNGHLTRMLAGLCAFRSGVKAHLAGTYDEYYSMAGGYWGTDQNALMSYFVDRTGPEFIKKHFLDTVIECIGGMCEHMGGFDAGKLPKETYDAIDLSHVPGEIRTQLDSTTQWPGQPVDARGETTRLLLANESEVAKKVKDIILSDAAAKEFYQQ